VNQEDIIKRYRAGWQDRELEQNEYKGYAALAMSGRLKQTGLAGVVASSSEAEGCDAANGAIEAPDELRECSDDASSLGVGTPAASGHELRKHLEERGRQMSMVATAPARDEHTTAVEHRAASRPKPSSADRVKRASDAAFRGAGEKHASPFAEGQPQQRLSTRIAIKANGRIVFIDPDDVVAVEAEGNYVSVRRRADSYLLRESISVMAEILKPFGFVRIHRSVLVNSSFVQQIRSRPAGAYGLRAEGGKEYTVTRTYKNNLKSLAAAWIGTDIFLDE
jgi:DNA-binding LytR/AlgR family response regulator